MLLRAQRVLVRSADANAVRGRTRTLGTSRGVGAVRGMSMVVVGTSALLAVLLGCSGDDDSSDEDPDSTEPPSESTTTTQPPSSDLAAMRPVVEGLLASWDEAFGGMLADPRAVIDDPEHELRSELAALFTTDSPYVADLDVLLGSFVDQDTGYRAASPGGVQQTTLVEFTESRGEDDIGFVFCSFNDAAEYSLATGEERPPDVGVRHGAGEARRVDGQWLLHRLQRLGLDVLAAGTPNPCPRLVAEEG